MIVRILITLLLLSCGSLFSTKAGEPPPLVKLTIKERVMRSTLIAIGTVEETGIVSTKSWKVVRRTGSLDENEKVQAVIKIERVLYASQREGPYYPVPKPGDQVSVIFGNNEMTVWDKPFKEQRAIFFLTCDFDSYRHYLAPFFDWTNLCVPVDQEGEVTRLIAAFEAVK